MILPCLGYLLFSNILDAENRKSKSKNAICHSSVKAVEKPSRLCYLITIKGKSSVLGGLFGNGREHDRTCTNIRKWHDTSEGTPRLHLGQRRQGRLCVCQHPCAHSPCHFVGSRCAVPVQWLSKLLVKNCPNFIRAWRTFGGMLVKEPSMVDPMETNFRIPKITRERCSE